MLELIGSENFSDLGQTTQVYKLTHDGAGNRLLHMDRSFISFTFGGKAIEDFNLIVVNSGDRMEKSFYTSFQDITTTQDTLNGQLYWGTNLEADKLELDLATDEMSEKQLDEFREWFAPGKNRELILSEHPNRAIIARVESAPTFSFLPFEKKVDVKINGQNYQTSTTVYRGEVKLSFVMDDPCWYGKLNFLPKYVDKSNLDILQIDDINSNKVDCLEDKDMLKIAFEDGIPYQDILSIDMFLGGNYLVTEATRTDVSYVGTSHIGTVSSLSNGFAINSNSPGYLFYSGTAKSYPTINFTMPLQFNNNNYIVSPKNFITDAGLTIYSYIKVGDKKFEFTTPSMLTAYNTAMKIFLNISSSMRKVDILDTIKNSVNEYNVRAWAIKCLNRVKSDLTSFSSSDINNLKQYMRNFFMTTTPSVTFNINSKTGEATGIFAINGQNDVTQTNDGYYVLIEENVGDMIRSDYLIIEGRNYINSNGMITQEDCKRIETNEELSNFFISFKNMYL